MKLAFTTLACPDWDLDQILAGARQYGYDAVDFRHYRGSTALTTLPEFTSGLAVTAKRVADAGLRVSGISSGIHVFSADPAKREQALAETTAYARIAAGLGASVLRVFGGKRGDTPRPQALAIAGRALRAMADAAAREGVVLALETHDDWCRGADVAALLDAAGAGRKAGVLWDVLNAWHADNEPPEETWRHIKGRLVGTHWKDCRTAYPATCAYCLPGTGVAPFKQFFDLLRDGGYDGYYTFEWERAWHPELEPPEVALPAFVKLMRKLEAGA